MVVRSLTMKHTRVVSLNARQAKPGVHLVDTTPVVSTDMPLSEPMKIGLGLKLNIFQQKLSKMVMMFINVIQNIRIKNK